jgi:hypothetical protein
MLDSLYIFASRPRLETLLRFLRLGQMAITDTVGENTGHLVKALEPPTPTMRSRHSGGTPT